MDDAVSCPLLTARHAHHSAVWCVTGYSFPKLCIACATERLENHSKGELNIHIKKILGEFQALLSSTAHACNSSEQSFFSVLSTDSRVVEHLCGLLFGLLQSHDATVAQSSLEVLMTLLGLAKTQDISRRLLQKTVQSILTSPNLPSSLPHLTLLGRLLHSHSALTFDLLHSYGSLLDFLLNGLSYPDEKIKSSVVYLLVQVAGKTPPTSLPLSLVQRLARHISTNLATAKSHDLTINLLGLVRHLLKSDSYTQCLIQADRLNADAKGSTFASAFKRVLLSQDELLQLSGVQCIAEVLTSHPDYGRTLLSADIAEFLFEALSSKTELLLNSLFNCLNSLAGIDEFYTKYHVVYGMEPILTGLNTLLKLRNHVSAQSGITLLTKILTRQPRGVSLFCSPTLLHNLLDLLTSLLEVECLATPTTAALSALISSQHVPSGTPLRPFLTPLAHLLSLLQPLTSADDIRETTVDFTASTKDLICNVFQCFSRVCRLSLEGGVVCVGDDDNDDRDFLLSAMRESLLPVFLLHLDHFDTPRPSVSVLSMADCLLQLLVTSQTGRELAETLCGTGFIQLILELKAKFPGSVEGASDLCSVGDQLLVKLCTTLEGSNVRVPYIKDALQQALPSLSGAPTDCLQVLTQRSQLPGRTTPSSLQSAQAAVLCLLCTAHTHGNQLVPASDLLRALDMFLSLNPDLHLLPPTTLSHITVLYAIASHDVPSCLNGSDVSSNRISGLAILTRGVQRVTDPTSLFVPHVSLMSWCLRQWGGGNDITKAWMQQWISLAHQSQSQAENLSLLLETSNLALQCVLGLISAPSSDDGMGGLTTVSELLEHLLLNSRENSSLWVTMYTCLNRIILEQRVHPLPDDSYGALLKLLAMTRNNKDCADLITSDVKLTYHIANLVCRVGVVLEDSTASAHGRVIAQCGLEILSVCVELQTSSSQIVRSLLSNQSLLHKLSTLLPRDSKAKTHNLLSAVVMEFITLLIAANDVVNHHIPLSAHTLMSALLSPVPRVQIAGLNLWGKVFSGGGVASPFIIQGVGQQPLRQLRTLTFLIMNCSVNGSVGVAEAAANCFVELTKYSHSLDKCKKGILSPWCLVLLRHSVDMYKSSILPLHRVTCLQQILQSMSLDSEFKGQPHTLRPTLRSLGQLLYKSLLTATSGNDVAQNLTSCLKQIARLDRGCLEEQQWRIVEQYDAVN
ncbi:meiosis inhibitor protein 1-like [Halichondria panicea]|uniref:meiosis inhibitor protein 1-like n=1 Tax=Halichondria panicea TaxID=6063 RepID=UPI00312B4110